MTKSEPGATELPRQDMPPSFPARTMVSNAALPRPRASLIASKSSSSRPTRSAQMPSGLPSGMS